MKEMKNVIENINRRIVKIEEKSFEPKDRLCENS
jgi:hypothetical protein